MDKSARDRHIATLRAEAKRLEKTPGSKTTLEGIRIALAAFEGKPLPKTGHASSSKHSTPRPGYSGDPRLRAMDLQVRRALGESTVGTKSIGSLQFAGVPSDFEPNK